MAKFSVGDTIESKKYNEQRVITAIGKRNYLYVATPGGTEYVRSIMEVDREYDKVEPFFQVGKTYQHPAGTIFEVTQVNTNSDGSRVAFGKATYNGGNHDWGTRYDITGWNQISK